MIDKSQLLRELQCRIDGAKRRGDWQSVELHTSTALRVLSTPDLSVSGLSRRIAKRIAATDARIPLTERIEGGRL